MKFIRKSKSSLHTVLSAGPIAVALALTFGTIDASAASGTWTAAVTANWSTTADWTGGIVADGAGFTATFTPNIGGSSRTVTLDTARTLGAITMSPTTTSNRSLTIKGLATNTLTFDNTPNSANAQLNFTTNRSGIISVASTLLNSSLDINDTGSSGGNFLGGGSITNNSPGAKTISFIGSNTAFFEVDESITDGTGGNGTLALTLNANRTVGIQGGNTFLFTYSGPTTIMQGTLQDQNGANSLSANSAMIINGGALDLYGFSEAIGSLSGSGGIITSSQAAARVLTVNQSTAGTYSGTIQNGSGTTALTKSGSQTLTLSGTNTYTGTTTISAGTLNVGIAAALPGTSQVVLGTATTVGTLQAGAGLNLTQQVTLNGGGVIDANGQTVTLNNVTDGGNMHTLVATDTSVGGGGIVNLTGTQTYTVLETAGKATINVNAAIGGGSSTVYANATTNFTTSQTLGALNIGGTAPAPALTASTADVGTGVAAAPEPGSLGLLLFGMLGLAARRRLR